MIPMDALLVFLMASAALSFAPGPDNIFVLTQSALHGRKARIWVTLGLCTGLFVHTGAVALGVAAIFQTSELAFNILKVVGASYLVYLAIQAFRAQASALDKQTNDTKLVWRALYIRGIVMNITNPKVAIFFLAFLPQFADPSLSSIPIQILLLGALFIVASLGIFSGIACFSGFIGEKLRHSPHAQTVMNRIAGIIFIGLATRLAMIER